MGFNCQSCESLFNGMADKAAEVEAQAAQIAKYKELENPPIMLVKILGQVSRDMTHDRTRSASEFATQLLALLSRSGWDMSEAKEDGLIDLMTPTNEEEHPNE